MIQLYPLFRLVFLFSFTSLSRLFQLMWDGQISSRAKTGELREQPPDTPANRTWIVPIVTSAGLETTPDTAVSRLVWSWCIHVNDLEESNLERSVGLFVSNIKSMNSGPSRLLICSERNQPPTVVKIDN